jgi:hypothetical protein
MTSHYLRILYSLTIGLRRFPLVVLSAIGATLAAILLNHHVHDSAFGDSCTRIILTLTLGYPLFAAATFSRELHPGSRWIAPLLSVFLLIALWYSLPLKMELGISWCRYWMLFLASLALLSLMPGTKTQGSANWWRMNVSLMNAIVLSGILSGIVLGGLELACFSVEKLFTLKVEKTYMDTFSFCSLFVFPLSVICLLPPSEGEADPSLPGFSVWGNLCKWAFLPLGFLFILILGAYAVQIVIQWKLPNGLVATPVLALGAYGTAAMLLLQPWKENHSWARWFGRIYPLAFLLCSILLFISLEKRITAYGITFERYFALTAGIWFFISALCFLLRLRNASVFVPFVLAIMALLAALGPLSAGKVSLQSQSARLHSFLAQPLVEQKKSAGEISSIVRFFAENYGVEVVERFTGPLNLAKDTRSWDISRKALEKLGLKGFEENVVENNSFNWTPGKPISIEGSRTLFMPENYGANQILLGKNAAGEELKIMVFGAELKGCVGSKDVVKLSLKSIVLPDSGKPEEFPVIPMQLENRKFSLLILSGNLEKDVSGKQTLSEISRFVVFEK